MTRHHPTFCLAAHQHKPAYATLEDSMTPPATVSTQRPKPPKREGSAALTSGARLQPSLQGNQLLYNTVGDAEYLVLIQVNNLDRALQPNLTAE